MLPLGAAVSPRHSRLCSLWRRKFNQSTQFRAVLSLAAKPSPFMPPPFQAKLSVLSNVTSQLAGILWMHMAATLTDIVQAGPTALVSADLAGGMPTLVARAPTTHGFATVSSAALMPMPPAFAPKPLGLMKNGERSPSPSARRGSTIAAFLITTP